MSVTDFFKNLKGDDKDKKSDRGRDSKVSPPDDPLYSSPQSSFNRKGDLNKKSGGLNKKGGQKPRNLGPANQKPSEPLETEFSQGKGINPNKSGSNSRNIRRSNQRGNMGSKNNNTRSRPSNRNKDSKRGNKSNRSSKRSDISRSRQGRNKRSNKSQGKDRASMIRNQSKRGTRINPSSKRNQSKSRSKSNTGQIKSPEKLKNMSELNRSDRNNRTSNSQNKRKSTQSKDNRGNKKSNNRSKEGRINRNISQKKGKASKQKSKRSSTTKKSQRQSSRKDQQQEVEQEQNKSRAQPQNEGTTVGSLQESDEEPIDTVYPLIPKDPEEGETVHAWAHIKEDKNGSILYEVVEPELSDEQQDNFEEIKSILKESIEVSFGNLEEDKARDFLEEKVDKIIEEYKFDMNQEQRDIIKYYAYKDFVGLGKIEAILNDSEIEDISCNGVNMPVYVYHRHPRIGSVKTNISFDDADELDSFVMKLAQRCGRSVSVANPLLDGSLPDGSRVQATLGTDIVRKGSNFTIRKFTQNPLTPIHLMEYETLNAEMFAYLWLAIEHGKSMLISGPTASGKTTLLNSLSLFIEPEMKVVSIEDTPELRLPHPNWVPEVARSGFGYGEEEGGEQITLDDLLKESLRQRPDYIIVGEVRGEEAYIMFQQMATGHPGMSTIHADSLDRVMNRLTTKPMNLPPTLIENLDLLIFIEKTQYKDNYLRLVKDAYEIRGYDREKDRPETNTVFEWNAQEGEFVRPSESQIISSIIQETGLDESKIQNDIKRRVKVLKWMKRHKIRNYKKVGKIISMYYSNASRVMNMVNQDRVPDSIKGGMVQSGGQRNSRPEGDQAPVES